MIGRVLLEAPPIGSMAASAPASPKADPFRGFACPHEILDGRLLEEIAVEYSRELSRRFVARHGRELRAAPGLAAYLREHLGRRLTFDAVWHDAFGAPSAMVLKRGDFGAVASAARLGLRLAESGRVGRWEASFDAPIQLQFGRWIFPPADGLRVRVTAGKCALDLRFDGAWGRATFSRAGRGWKAGRMRALPSVAVGGARCTLTPAGAVNPRLVEGLPGLAGPEADASRDNIRAGCALIAAYAPLYRGWVGRVLKKIVPVGARSGRILSGSDRDAPGTIYLSASAPAVAIAEMLIHEATHQYYYILARYGPLDDGSDREFYSPIKGTLRPARMILLAYHAFANVMLFYRMCRRRGLADAGYCEANERDLEPQLRQLQDPLENARALTPLGDALWQPLAERLW